jgi:hypothetical protein
MKAGTSSLASDLEKHLGVPGIDGKKEFHFFDRSTNSSKQAWLDRLPPCDSQARFLADMTPRNLRLVPFPQGVQPPDWWQDWDVPKTLYAFYGGEQIQDLTFVVMLRNPLARVQSQFYCAMLPENSQDQWAAELHSDSFTHFVRDSLANATGTPPSYNDALWGSMYAQQLAAFLEFIPASRFVVIPSNEYYSNPTPAFQEITRRLGASHLDNNITRAASVNLNPHPDLQFDIAPDLRLAYDNFMADDNAALVALLSKMLAEGAYLHGCSNCNGDANITAWLKASW